MVNYPDLNERERLFERCRDEFVGTRGIFYRARMLMDQDDRGGVASQNQLDDLTRCYVRPIQRAAEQLDEVDEMMASREQQHAEDLVFQVRKARYQEIFDGTR